MVIVGMIKSEELTGVNREPTRALGREIAQLVSWGEILPSRDGLLGSNTLNPEKLRWR
jgi:hypothetical protein